MSTFFVVTLDRFHVYTFFLLKFLTKITSETHTLYVVVDKIILLYDTVTYEIEVRLMLV